MQGALFLVVGPSGVGKDSLIDAARDALGAHEAPFVFARRVVTRPVDAGGEAHEPMTADEFAAAEADGAFCVTWGAHGLRYGVRVSALAPLARGCNVVVNVSRKSIAAFLQTHRRTIVLSVTAPAEVVRRRLEARNREDAADVAARLARDVRLDGAFNVVTIDNGGDLDAAARQFVAAMMGAACLPLTLRASPIDLPGDAVAILRRDALPLRSRQILEGMPVEVIAGERVTRVRLAFAQDDTLLARTELAVPPTVLARLRVPVGAAAELRRGTAPASRDVLRRKIAGEELGPADIGTAVRDIVEGRYSEAEIAGFLVALSRHLSVAEVAALTCARAELFERIDWGGRIVLDKHSMGGVPASPISTIVVPIVAAHGIVIPKTSSRAITSAAGTADVMECRARVDLTPAQMVAVVESAGGALVWSGRICHSRLDDVMNAINRPLGIRSAMMDVASILSKKLAVGSTHVAIDIPVGPANKVRTSAAGQVLARLFEEVARSVGLTVMAVVTDGTRPVGRGVGPALEFADARRVLCGTVDAPAGLREKALAFAGAMLEWDPAIAPGTGRCRAEDLLASGAAGEAFDRIAEAQGLCPPVEPGVFTHAIRTGTGGTLRAIDAHGISGLARAVGAPADKGAGVRLLAVVGDTLAPGAVLAEVVATGQGGIERVIPDAARALFTVA